MRTYLGKKNNKLSNSYNKTK